MMPAYGQPRDDLDDLAVPMGVKLGACSSMLAGAFTLALSIQTVAFFRMRGSLVLIVATMALLGAASVVTGWGTLRGSGRAAIAAACAGGLIATLGSVWAVVGLMSGVLSPLSFGVILLGTVSAVLAGIAIGPARKVSDARERLRRQGLDFGI